MSRNKADAKAQLASNADLIDKAAKAAGHEGIRAAREYLTATQGLRAAEDAMRAEIDRRR